MNNGETEKKIMSLLSSAELKEDKSKLFKELRAYLEDKGEADYDYDESNSKEALEQLFKIFTAKNTFEKGVLVKWKKGLKNRRRPKYFEPSIVIDYIKENPPLNSAEEGSSLYREPLDLALGLIDENGDFDIFYFDSRRFEPY